MEKSSSRANKKRTKRISKAPGKPQVLLVNMPFASLYRPTIALSLLKAQLTARAIDSTILYFTIPMAERIGSEFYVRLANQAPLATDLVGEWIFAGELFPGRSDTYIDEILGPGRQARGHPYEDASPVAPEFIEDVLKVRAIAGDFLDSCAGEVLRFAPRIVAFTSVFQQQVSSLALAKRIKKQNPDTFIVFGGSNCENLMGAELARQFSFVDAVVSGEGDIVFPEIVRRVFEGKQVSDLRGVYTRSNCEAAAAQGVSWRAESVSNMDTLPAPDYDDFFRRHHNSTLNPAIERQILFETSRGCWWGERSHCTFCGLSKEAMTYRSKSQGRALEELKQLAAKHPGCAVIVVDDILDLKYFKEFVPGLAAQKLNLRLFYETKANLKKEQVKLLHEAGITMIQPGIESFSDSVLALMGKGVSALQNIQLLKWCREWNIEPFWNILWGFPGEDPDEYSRIADLIPLLTHFAPPQCMARIRLDRFSPNFQFAEQMGFTNVKPYPAYSHVYALPDETVANIAYFFLYDYSEPRDVEGYTMRVREEVKQWWLHQNDSALFSVDKGSHLLIWDFRPGAAGPLTVLTGLQKALYLACDSIRRSSELLELATQLCRHGVCDSEVEELLEPLVQRGILLRKNHSYLNLAVPLGIYTPGPEVLARFSTAVQQLSTPIVDGFAIPLPAECAVPVEREDRRV